MDAPVDPSAQDRSVSSGGNFTSTASKRRVSLSALPISLASFFACFSLMYRIGGHIHARAFALLRFLGALRAGRLALRPRT